MEVRVINKSGNPLPKYETVGSAGMDLRANIENTINFDAFERKLIPTGLFIELPNGFEAQIRPRSGLSLKKGITLINSPGTIDTDYRGEIKIILINLSTEPQSIDPGERIAQMVISSYTQIELVQADIIESTERGDGGFGHTGTK